MKIKTKEKDFCSVSCHIRSPELSDPNMVLYMYVCYPPTGEKLCPIFFVNGSTSVLHVADWFYISAVEMAIVQKTKLHSVKTLPMS